MEIRKINLNSKKGQGMGINKTVGIILVILVIAIAFVFLLRANIAKWLGFLPDYKSEEERKPCEVSDSCVVLNEDGCFCKNNAGAYQPCKNGEYCYANQEGCLIAEPSFYSGTQECKK